MLRAGHVGWDAAEAELGLTVPEDDKELCGAFGVGEFSDFLNLLSPDLTGTFSGRFWFIMLTEPGFIEEDVARWFPRPVFRSAAELAIPGFD